MSKIKLLSEKIAVFYVSIFVLFVLLLLANRVDPIVKVDDPGLMSAIREKLDKPSEPIHKSDLLLITKLDASDRQIKDLSGIENLRKLVYLDLSDNMPEDLSPLSELNMLTTLILDNTEITELDGVNFDALKDLPLRELSLRENIIEDDGVTRYALENIEALSNLKGLEELDLRGNNIFDINPLEHLRELKALDLRENQVEDISALKKLSDLESLNLRENNVVCLEPLRGLKRLRYLNIHSNTEIISLEPLSGLFRLRTLILRNVRIGNETRFLANMTRLRRLNIRNCGIKDMSFFGYLMENGALQDNESRGKIAEVDIRENVAVQTGKDMYSALRPYWANITKRMPYDLLIPSVQSSHKGGFYNEEFLLELSHEDPGSLIYYTLDGSDPDPVNNPENTVLYRTPLYIRNRKEEPNTISLIDTGYGDFEGYSAWQGPDGQVFKATVVKARAFVEDSVSSVVTHTFFVDENMDKRYGLPIISIVVDPDDLFDHERGIFVRGRIFDDTVEWWRKNNTASLGHHQPANFHQRGRSVLDASGIKVRRFAGNRTGIPFKEHGLDLDFEYLRVVPQITIEGTKKHDGIHYLSADSTENMLAIDMPFSEETFPKGAQISRTWERQVHLEFFEDDGSHAFSQKLGIRVHGGASRAEVQKPMRFYARPSYGGSGIINYRFFSRSDTEFFKRFILRPTTERTGLDDVLGQLFMKKVHPEMNIQRYRPVVLFLNGEFWGLYSLRDRYDGWYLAFKFDINRDDVTVLNWDHILKQGDPGDEIPFRSLDYVIRHKDMSNDAIYRQVMERMDEENYISYMLTGIYLNYTDWGASKHQLVWQYKGARDSGALKNKAHLDGKWRWLPLDLDGAFSRGGGPENYYFPQIADSMWYHLHFLLDNRNFRIKFINRFADTMNTVFREDVAIELVDKIVNALPRRVIKENIRRWRHLDSIEEWDEHISFYYDFLQRRPSNMRQHIVDYFDLDGIVGINLRINSGKGYLRINSIDIIEGTAGVDDIANWSGIYFKGVPIEVEAVPERGFVFAGWEELDGGENLLTFELSENITLTARFVEL